MPKPLLVPGLSSLNGIAHGFFTRHGGVSAGIYASLNCGIGSKDEPAAIRENRGRVTSHLGADDLASAYQVHGTTALVVSAPWPAGERPKADAMVTATPGIALGVLTADCAPVLFADAQARVVAAAHAGWRGALSGVVEAAIEAMEGLGAQPRAHPGGRRVRALARMPTRWVRNSRRSFSIATAAASVSSPHPT